MDRRSTIGSLRGLEALARVGALSLAASGLLVAGCAPVAPQNYAYVPAPMYRWQPSPADYGSSFAQGTPDGAGSQRSEPEPAPPPKAPEPPKSAGLEDTAGWWRGGGIFWPRWQEPIP